MKPFKSKTRKLECSCLGELLASLASCWAQGHGTYTADITDEWVIGFIDYSATPKTAYFLDVNLLKYPAMWFNGDFPPDPILRAVGRDPLNLGKTLQSQQSRAALFNKSPKAAADNPPVEYHRKPRFDLIVGEGRTADRPKPDLHVVC